VAIFVFSLLTFIVAIPSAVKVFNWVATMYKGSIQMSPPLLFTLGFIFLFSLGGLTGLIQGSAGTDIHIHDTHFIVGHFHFVMFGGTGFAFFAALHFWWPKIFGRMYDFKKAYIAATIITIGFIGNFFPMFILGIMGLPRRYYDYMPKFQTGNMIAGVFAYVLIAGILLMFVNLFLSFGNQREAKDDPWGATTLEWTIPSPPPLENFVKKPVVMAYPYDFSNVTAEK
jgi:cytochrome c oxidase subunit I